MAILKLRRRTATAKRGVDSRAIVEDLDVIEDGERLMGKDHGHGGQLNPWGTPPRVLPSDHRAHSSLLDLPGIVKPIISSALFRELITALVPEHQAAASTVARLPV